MPTIYGIVCKIKRKNCIITQEKQMKETQEYLELSVGRSKQPWAVVVDIPIGLSVGDIVKIVVDTRFCDKTFLAGSKVKFLGYVVQQRTRVTFPKKVFVRRALFRFKGERINRFLGSEEIEIKEKNG